MKTHKSISKRFKKTKNGLLKMRVIGKNHGMIGRPSRKRKALTKMQLIKKTLNIKYKKIGGF